MDFVASILLWPVAVFLQAVCGVLGPAKTPKIAMYQRIARLTLLGSVVVFSTMPLFLIVPVVGIKPPLALGVVLLFVFVVIGKLCDDQAGDQDVEISEDRG